MPIKNIITTIVTIIPTPKPIFSKKSKKIWAKTISELPKSEHSWYEIPNGITSSIINPISGELSINGKGYTCYYEKGTEPNYKYYFESN